MFYVLICESETRTPSPNLFTFKMSCCHAVTLSVLDICKQPHNSSLSQLSFIFFTTYCYFLVVQLGMSISQQILLYCASIILITPYQSMNPYICSLFIFVDSSFLVTLVFLNEYSIIQVKFISCGPAVLLGDLHPPNEHSLSHNSFS